MLLCSSTNTNNKFTKDCKALISDVQEHIDSLESICESKISSYCNFESITSNIDSISLLVRDFQYDTLAISIMDISEGYNPATSITYYLKSVDSCIKITNLIEHSVDCKALGKFQAHITNYATIPNYNNIEPYRCDDLKSNQLCYRSIFLLKTKEKEIISFKCL